MANRFVVEVIENTNEFNVKAAENKTEMRFARLSLKLPADIKEYLNEQAARESLIKKRNVSLTQYLCKIVREDMAKNGFVAQEALPDNTEKRSRAYWNQ